MCGGGSKSLSLWRGWWNVFQIIFERLTSIGLPSRSCNKFIITLVKYTSLAYRLVGNFSAWKCIVDEVVQSNLKQLVYM